jgi:hypothetical protein
VHCANGFEDMGDVSKIAIPLSDNFQRTITAGRKAFERAASVKGCDILRLDVYDNSFELLSAVRQNKIKKLQCLKMEVSIATSTAFKGSDERLDLSCLAFVRDDVQYNFNLKHGGELMFDSFYYQDIEKAFEKVKGLQTKATNTTKSKNKENSMEV